MSSKEDLQLEAALARCKASNAAYLDDETPAREKEFARAMSGLAKEMDATAKPALRKRAVGLRQVKDRFEGSRSVREKHNIAATVAKSLVRLTVKKLVFWGIHGIGALAVAGSLVYVIATEGDWTAAYDTNNDGWTDEHDFDTTGDGVADHGMIDTDHDHHFDTIQDLATGDIESSGVVVEVVSTIFSWFS